MASLRACLMLLSMGAAALPLRAEMPRDFVYLSDFAPTILQDMRYASAHNFIGRPIDGYRAPECVVTRQAAAALAKVQAALAKDKLSLVMWDCYRPERAVADFWRWSQAPSDAKMKAEFYPGVEKGALFASGYLAKRSAHSRGSTVDLGIAPAGAAIPAFPAGAPLVACTAPKGERFEDGAVDFGTGYDCLDPKAGVNGASIPEAARNNRLLLRRLMIDAGFKPYTKEWWHFELANEPFPNRAFDFEIEPKRR